MTLAEIRRRLVGEVKSFRSFKVPEVSEVTQLELVRDYRDFIKWGETYE
jgi:hypothetical protein